MTTKLDPYLSFGDNACDAMQFYQSIFGGKLTMSTFKDFHASQDPSEDNLVMHAVLESGDITLMASDTPRRMNYQPGMHNFSLALSGEDEAQLKAYFGKLSAGGTVTMPLEKSAWGDTFGMCTDQFGVNWMVNISAKPA